jgi:hypothetical protein
LGLTLVSHFTHLFSCHSLLLPCINSLLLH